MTPDVRVIRDNLNVGLYLSHSRFGATLENILQTALGFDLGRGHLREDFVRRFRNAQAVGRDAFRGRIPGYFTFNAMPFGNGYIYKATWFVWVNPQTGQSQTVPLLAGDLVVQQHRNDDKFLQVGHAFKSSPGSHANPTKHQYKVVALLVVHQRCIDW